MTDVFEFFDVDMKPIQQLEMASLPQSLLSNSRIEYYDEPSRDRDQCSLILTIKSGLSDNLTVLPDDLQGHFFVVGPSGAIDSNVMTNSDSILPAQNGWTSVLNGDGMVYRIDFSSGQARLSSRLLKTVSSYADSISHQKYPLLKFLSYGITRISEYIGICDQSNTAFLPLGQKQNTADSLLVTWDMGRPLEIDPVSLKTIGPVGSNQHWREVAKFMFTFQPLVLKFIMSSAHPIYIPESGDVFAVNVVKSIREIVGLSQLWERGYQLAVAKFKRIRFSKRMLRLAFTLSHSVIDLGIRCLKMLKFLAKENVYIVRWNSKTDKFESWKLCLPNGESIRIRQTVHQMGLTQKYIIFADTAFKTYFGAALPSKSQLKDLKLFERIFFSWLHSKRNYLTFSLSKETPIYLIERNQFEQVSLGKDIIAKRIVLEDASIAHYEVDYDDTDDKIIVHAALNSSTDFAEFVRQDDCSAFDDVSLTQRMKSMAGIFVTGMEVNCPVTYVLDAKQGTVEREVRLPFEEACKNTWSLGICTYPNHLSSDRHENIYWSNFGAWPEALPQSILELYKERYAGQPQKLETFLKQVKEGLPTSICRIHIARPGGCPDLSVADSYEFPKNGYFANSPQFIPKENATGSLDGYIICTVNYSDNLCSKPKVIDEIQPSWSENTEFWIFDAASLKQGPLYRLSHAKLNLGMTVHTTWLREISSPKKCRRYNVRQDYEKRVAAAVKYNAKRNPSQAGQIAQLFEEIYAQVEQEKPY